MDLQTIFRLFPDEGSCVTFLEEARWNGKPVCPYCRFSTSSPMPRERRHHCNYCGLSFSVTAQSAMLASTKLDLRLWLLALWLATEAVSTPAGRAPRRISGRALAVELGVNRNTASLMLAKIQLAQVKEPGFVAAILRKIIARTEGVANGRPR